MLTMSMENGEDCCFLLLALVLVLKIVVVVEFVEAGFSGLATTSSWINIVVGDGTMNRPSDATGERAVVNALALVRDAAGCR